MKCKQTLFPFKIIQFQNFSNCKQARGKRGTSIVPSRANPFWKETIAYNYLSENMSVNVSMSTRLGDFCRFRLFLIFIHCGLWIKIHSSQSTPADCLSFLQIRQNWSEIDFSNYYPFSTWSSFEDHSSVYDSSMTLFCWDIEALINLQIFLW